jgi:transposase-like protein
MEKGNCDFLLKNVVEIDEAYFGGKEKNKHSKKKLKAGRGAVGKTPVFGMVERNGQLFAKVISDQKTETFSKIITEKVEAGTILNTDEATWYNDIENFGYERKVVNHSAKQFVDNMAYTNTIESVWALLKRGYYGIFHSFSAKHLQQYVNEFQFRWNEGNCKYSTMDRIDNLIAGCWDKVLPYKALVA